ncbi:MAG: hypothetical protein JST67_10850 [Bacteroidetes bacterium]|nr:hypothetical protein [Bacteroidota bacterium]
MNLVIGAATGYTYEQIKLFLSTLKKTGYQGDVCLFVNNQNTKKDIELLKKNDVIVYPIQAYLQGIPKFISQRRFSRVLKPIHWFLPKFATLMPLKNKKKLLLIGSVSSFFLSVACSRYYYYYKFLSQQNFKYDAVLFSDVRDVVFQSNPFEKLKDDDSILFALEHKTCLLGTDPSNSRWVKHLYSTNEINKIKNYIVSCSGTTLARKNYYESYLAEMIKETAKQTHKIIGAYGFDQGIHNYLLRINAFKKYSLQYNGEGIYCTMLTTPSDEFKLIDNKIVNNDNSIIPIIHQYNWFPNIKLKVLEKL